MNEFSKSEIPCGRATMYVISEKGLEIGPFAFGMRTENRILNPIASNMYFSRKSRDAGQSSTEATKPKAGKNEEKKLRIVDLASSLPSDELDRGIRRNFREIFARNFLQSRGKKRKEKQIDAEEKIEKSSALSGEILKQVLTPKEDDFSAQRQFIGYLRESRLKGLGIVKERFTDSESLTFELSKLRARRLNISLKNKDTEIKQLKPNHEYNFLKNVFSQAVRKNHSVSKGLTLPAVKTEQTTTQTTPSETSRQQLTKQPPKENKNMQKRTANEALIFLSPRLQYCPTRAETAAKININSTREVSRAEPKVSLPAVIDKRTGCMHSVPGEVALQLYDYNRWSRKRNFIKRSSLKTRAQAKTVVSVLPAISEGQERRKTGQMA